MTQIPPPNPYPNPYPYPYPNPYPYPYSYSYSYSNPSPCPYAYPGPCPSPHPYPKPPPSLVHHPSLVPTFWQNTMHGECIKQSTSFPVMSRCHNCRGVGVCPGVYFLTRITPKFWERKVVAVTDWMP